MANILYTIFEQVQKKKEQGKQIIGLNVGEPDQKPPLIIAKTISKALKEGRINYGSAAGEISLRKAIAQKHQVEFGNVVIGPGSKFLIYAFLKTILTKKDDEIIMPSPIWGTYESTINNIGLGKIKFLKTDFSNNWQINIKKLTKLINNKTKAIIICNPNNPTSTIINSVIIKKIIALINQSNIKLIFDNAYKGLIFKPQEKLKLTKLNNIIQIYSFSKTFAMTGFRLGYAITDKTLINQIIKFNQITITCVPQFIQEAGLMALKKETDFTKKLAKIYYKRALLAGKILNTSGIKFIAPDAGFYIFAKLSKVNGEEFALKLLNRGVAVVPGSTFGLYNDFIRISLTVPEKELIKGLKIICAEFGDN